MAPEEFKDAQMLFRYSYAWDAFRQARISCEHVKNNILNNTSKDDLKDHPIYTPLMVGIYVLYARPFSQSHGLKESHGIIEKIIPKNMMDTHQQILAFRNKIFAHTDSKGIDLHSTAGNIDNSNRLDFIVDPRGIQQGHIVLIPRHVQIDNIFKLLTELEKKCLHHLERLTKKYRKRIPKEYGTYTLNILNESGPFVTRNISA